MNKAIGYISSIVGFVVIGLSNEKVKANFGIEILEKLPSISILIPGLILVGLGVFILVLENKKGNNYNSKQEKEEVPIYKGEGKNRRIVGYRKE